MSNQPLLKQLQDDIAAIKTMLATSGTPANEAQTESLIIDPLLKSLGYSTTDYVKQGFSSVANNFPDYTVLPTKPQKWVLEVKKYGHVLKSPDEAQATSYGFHAATEWAVLTNGTTWYIYNIPLKSSARRVLQIDDIFNDGGAIMLLACLSLQGMLQDKLTEAWTMKRVSSLIEAEMGAANSSLRSYLRQLVKQSINLDVDDALLGTALLQFAQGQNSPAIPAIPINKTTVLPTGGTPGQTISKSPTMYTFGDIVKNPSLGIKKRPTNLTFDNGSTVSVTTWADAAKVIVSTIGSQYNLPSLPFSASKKGKNYFLNGTPTHGNGGKMHHYREAQIGNTKVYINTNYNVESISACLVAFLNAVGAPLDTVRVSIP